MHLLCSSGSYDCYWPLADFVFGLISLIGTSAIGETGHTGQSVEIRPGKCLLTTD